MRARVGLQSPYSSGSWNVLPQVTRAVLERNLAVIERTLISPVLDFDANRAIVAGFGQHGKELAPVDIVQPGKLGCLEIVGVRHDADVVQAALIEPCVLGVDVEDAVAEFAQRLQVVHALPDEVRRIEVEAEVPAGNVFEGAPPRGDVMRFLPPGHSSLVKAIAQFSMPTLTPWSSAN